MMKLYVWVRCRGGGGGREYARVNELTVGAVVMAARVKTIKNDLAGRYTKPNGIFETENLFMDLFTAIVA